MQIDFLQIFSASIVLFAVIDILGSMPIIISIREKGGDVNAVKATLVATVILLVFMYLGEALLNLFGVDLNSFAVAGSFVLFIIGLEMVVGFEVFKQDSPGGATIVPVAFPLLAGPGTFTALLSMRAEYEAINIVIALLINMVWVFILLKSTNRVAKVLGSGGLFVIKKFFGIIVLAISVRLFASNLVVLINQFNG